MATCQCDKLLGDSWNGNLQDLSKNKSSQKSCSQKRKDVRTCKICSPVIDQFSHAAKPISQLTDLFQTLKHLHIDGILSKSAPATLHSLLGSLDSTHHVDHEMP